MSAVPSRAHEIARRTLRLLASRRIVPTPENYRELYAEVAGNGDGAAEPAPAQWATLLREFVRAARENHHGLPTAEKLSALDRALVAGGDLRAMYSRLQALAGTWAQLPVVLKSRPAGDAGAGAASDAARELTEVLAQTLELGVAARLIEQPELASEVTDLAARLRSPAAPAPAALRAQLKALWLKIELQGNARGELQQGLLQLLRLLVDNVGELVMDDQWLRGQIAVVQQAVTPPLDLEAIADAERNLKDVIFKQGLLKQSLNEAKGTLKQMVTAFIDQLGALSETTGDYHDTMESLAQRIRKTEDVGHLKDLLDEVMRETRNVQASTLRARGEVLEARQQVDAAERRIRALETDLSQASARAREDHLTGALNRRGLHEAFERELAAVQRHGRPLSIALLDIDNLRDLNHTYGHHVGDDALAHLAGVIRETVRPGDVVARFRGEQFLLLLPGSDTGQAVDVMVRLQRELTKRFFLHQNNRLLITFSAGVSRHAAGETQATAIKRVDGALQRARRTGRNQVAAAE